jgi:hypothetical protein
MDSTGHTLVVGVGSVTGLVHARKPGGAIVSVRFKGRSGGLSAIEVRVAET